MFGYIYVNEQELKLREFQEYRGFYCGLCRNLQNRYGRTAQMMLNYDLTFLAILLTGLYEPQQEETRRRCIIHPVHRHRSVENETIDYAADMSVLLSVEKLEDDWKDEKKLPQHAMAGILRRDYEAVCAKYPRQVAAVKENIRLLAQAEQEGMKDIDYVSGLTGHFLEEIYVWKEDEWQEELRTMGFYIGKFVYLMDALEDVNKDRKHGNYNLFTDAGDVWEDPLQEKIRGHLAGMMAEAARAFERLPVVEYAGIIRNILYSGVWSKYEALRKLRNKEVEKIKKP
jgi:hypothetical protein